MSGKGGWTVAETAKVKRKRRSRCKSDLRCSDSKGNACQGNNSYYSRDAVKEESSKR